MYDKFIAVFVCGSRSFVISFSFIVSLLNDILHDWPHVLAAVEMVETGENGWKLLLMPLCTPYNDHVLHTTRCRIVMIHLIAKSLRIKTKLKRPKIKYKWIHFARIALVRLPLPTTLSSHFFFRFVHFWAWMEAQTSYFLQFRFDCQTKMAT